jgi:hypothetical protein
LAQIGGNPTYSGEGRESGRGAFEDVAIEGDSIEPTRPSTDPNWAAIEGKVSTFERKVQAIEGKVSMIERKVQAIEGKSR